MRCRVTILVLLIALASPLVPVATVAAEAADSCTVLGTLLGHDGAPLRSAFVRPIGGPDRLLATRPDGSFTFVFPRPGGYYVWLGGVHHRTWLLPLLLQQPGETRIEVRLAPVETLGRLDSVRVIGDFNGFSEDGAIPMRERPDGTFAAVVDCKTDTLRYQLLGVQAGGDPLCGTQADALVFDRSRPMIGGRSGRYLAAVHAGARPVEVRFDPRLLPRSGSPPRFHIEGDPEGDAAAIVEIDREAQERGAKVADAVRRYLASGADPDSFRWDDSEVRHDLAARIAAERRALCRHFLLLQYFHLEDAARDSTLARAGLQEIPADSPLWSLEWGGPDATFGRIARVARRPGAARSYADHVISSHPDVAVRAGFLFHALLDARRAGDAERAARCSTRLLEEHGESRYARRLRQQAIQKGRPAPDVAFAALEDSTRRHRIADFRGRYLLLDFWAVWCGPCVAEMRHLHAAEAKYAERGLAILSVSLDRKPGTVAKFRAAKWRMPWLHAHARDGIASGELRAFEIVGIPRPVLLDRAGTIVALDDELRGANLDATLARFLGGAAGGPGGGRK